MAAALTISDKLRYKGLEAFIFMTDLEAIL